jgi:hypothetical protein
MITIFVQNANTSASTSHNSFIPPLKAHSWIHHPTSSAFAPIYLFLTATEPVVVGLSIATSRKRSSCFLANKHKQSASTKYGWLMKN